MHVALAEIAQRLVRHHRAEVRAADADADHVADALARMPCPLPAAHAVGERRHAVEHLVHLCDHVDRSEEHTSELQSLMRISYAVFCLKKKTHNDSDYPLEQT